MQESEKYQGSGTIVAIRWVKQEERQKLVAATSSLRANTVPPEYVIYLDHKVLDSEDQDNGKRGEPRMLQNRVVAAVGRYKCYVSF